MARSWRGSEGQSREHRPDREGGRPPERKKRSSREETPDDLLEESHLEDAGADETAPSDTDEGERDWEQYLHEGWGDDDDGGGDKEKPLEIEDGEPVEESSPPTVEAAEISSDLEVPPVETQPTIELSSIVDHNRFL